MKFKTTQPPPPQPPPPSTPPPPYTAMEDPKDKLKKTNNKKKQQKHSQKTASDNISFKLSSEVKGLRFGGQFIVKSFTIRRATPLETLRLLALPPNPDDDDKPQFMSTTAFLPTNFTILAHHAWHTLTLGLGTKKSKVVIFVFESENLKSAVDRIWPSEISLGEVNKKLIRGLNGCEMARFKFRKGAITFYVYGVRRIGTIGFTCAADLRLILETVAALKDFLDHTAMLALPNQRSISFSQPVAMVC